MNRELKETTTISTQINVKPIIFSLPSSATGGDKIDVYAYGHSKEKNIAIVLKRVKLIKIQVIHNMFNK